MARFANDTPWTPVNCSATTDSVSMKIKHVKRDDWYSAGFLLRYLYHGSFTPDRSLNLSKNQENVSLDFRLWIPEIF